MRKEKQIRAIFEKLLIEKVLLIQSSLTLFNTMDCGLPVSSLIISNRGWWQKPSQRKRKAEWLSEQALQIVEKRSERPRRKGKTYPNECKVSENSKDIKEAFLSEQWT